MAEDHILAQRVAVAAAEPAPPPVVDDVYYPDSDGRFLADNPLQADAIMNVRFALAHHFANVQNVMLRGDMFVYFERGNPAASIAPDVFVVLDHDAGMRPVYKIWEEGKPPDFALEVVSPSSRIRNEQEKRDLYARLGIGEYFLFQPDSRKRGRRLVGYRLRRGIYAEVPADRVGALRSQALGVSMRVEGTNLRLRSLATGQDYAWIEENPGIVEGTKAEAQAAKARAQASKAQAHGAKA